jgi:hypothetical protein
MDQGFSRAPSIARFYQEDSTPFPDSGPPACRNRLLLEVHVSSPCSNPSYARLKESGILLVTEETAEP